MKHNITGVNKVHLKCDCIIGSIVNGVRETVLFSFALDSPPGHEIFEGRRIKLFKKMPKSVLTYITFSLEVDDHKPVDFICSNNIVYLSIFETIFLYH